MDMSLRRSEVPMDMSPLRAKEWTYWDYVRSS